MNEKFDLEVNDFLNFFREQTLGYGSSEIKAFIKGYISALPENVIQQLIQSQFMYSPSYLVALMKLAIENHVEEIWEGSMYH